jgi:hypothetical protein
MCARILAARSARGLACSFRPLISEGAGNAGRPMRPIAACAMSVVERTRVGQVTPENARHSPRNGFNGFLRALPGDRAFLPPSPLRNLHLRNLTPASGRQNHTTSPSASGIARQARRPRPPHPAPRFVTLRNAPLWDGTARVIKLIWVFGKPEYFCKEGWTEGSANCPGDLPVGWSHRKNEPRARVNDMAWPGRPKVSSSLRGAQRRSNPAFLLATRWIASRSLSSGAHSRDPLARNDGCC